MQITFKTRCYTLLLILFIINISQADENDAKNLSDNFLPNQVVVKKAPDGYGDLYRVFLEKNNKGYLVQEFYLENHQEATEPFILLNKEDVTRLPKYYFDDNPTDKLSINSAYKRFYPSGQTERQGRYLNGQREGQWTHWYDNGIKHIEAFYVHGKLNGISKTWREDGSLSSEIFSEYGAILIVNSIDKNDSKRSHWIEFYKSGQAMQSGNMLNTKREGVWVFWDAKGKQESIGFFKEGKRHGVWRTYWPKKETKIDRQTLTTVKRSEGEYRFGKKIGTWLYWDEQGNETKNVYNKTP